MFKECPHPDEKQRLELSKRLCLETRQVKFWFQNRRTQMKVFFCFFMLQNHIFNPKNEAFCNKMLLNHQSSWQTQLERHENALLRQENDKLRAENMSIREAMRNPICTNCGGQAMLGDVSLEEHHLRIENARLKDELDRVCNLTGKFLGHHHHQHHHSSSLELAVGTNNGGNFAFHPDFGGGVCLPPPQQQQPTGINGIDQRSVLLELALTAMDELVKLAHSEEPLWVKSLDGERDELNQEEYMRTFSSSKPTGLVTEASRTSSMVIINSLALVETLMDSVSFQLYDFFLIYFSFSFFFFSDYDFFN